MYMDCRVEGMLWQDIGRIVARFFVDVDDAGEEGGGGQLVRKISSECKVCRWMGNHESDEESNIIIAELADDEESGPYATEAGGPL